MRGRTALALCITVIAFWGEACGVADPYTRTHVHRAEPARAPEETRAARRPARLPPARAQPTADAALRAFALAWTNWSWRTIGRSERQRARLASGGLRRQLTEDAAAGADTTLARDRTASRGDVVAIALQARGRAYVVVRETQTSAGLEAIGDRTVRVYRAAVARAARGWLVAAWAPLD
jgi:hypothetical protein